MKRFYQNAASGPDAGGGFAVLLDGRPVRTPDKRPMIAPTRALADAVAAEWQVQGDTIKADTMPLTQLLTTAVDKAGARDEITKSILAYLDSDLLCYRAPDPAETAAEQNRLWSPWLVWFERRFGTALATTTALARLDQPDTAHRAVDAYIGTLDPHRFTVLQVATALTGSLVLALALLDGAIDADDALACALCEERFYERFHKLEDYGHDPAETKRRAALARDLRAAATYLKTL